MLTDEDRDTLLRLFDLAEIGEGARTSALNGNEPHHSIGLGEEAVVLRGSAARMLWGLTESLSGHALTQGGPAPTAVQTVLTSAIFQGAHGAVEDAVAAVEDFLAREPVDWLVIAENRDLVHDRDLDLGACRIQKELPDLDPDVHESSVMVVESVEPPVIYTTVTAVDSQSALIIGRERFGDARAVLAIADSLRSTVGRRAVAVRPVGAGSQGKVSDDRLNSWTIVNKDEDMRPLIPGFHELSLQAAVPYAERTKWGRRVLAAARWYHSAISTAWHAEAVSAAMSALETLLVVGQEDKGEAVARKVTERFGVLPGFDADAQQVWLKGLYRKRSGALHGGSVMDRDRDVERLLILTRWACRWGVWHLDPFHRRPNASCESQTDAFDAELHRH